MLNRMLVLFGLRARQEHWGVVYDSKTKQSLDPVVVKLIDAKSGKVAQTFITDITGRYGFLSWPGKYKIFARKTNYTFPSHLIEGDKDSVYENLYRGEFFEVLGDAEVIAFNIPMDPQREDWNQQEKERMFNYSPRTENFLRVLTISLFWIVLAVFIASKVYFPFFLTKYVLYFYGAVILLAILLPKNRLWGRVVSKSRNTSVSDVELELSHTRMPNIVIARTSTIEDGKFFMRVQKGDYILRIRILNLQGAMEEVKTVNLTVGMERAITQDFFID